MRRSYSYFPLTLTLGNRSRRCSTSCIHAVVSRREREKLCALFDVRITMKVLIPSSLLSYTKKQHVEASGATLMELLADLEHQFPGIRFRVIDEQGQMRGHMRFFVNNEQVFELSHALKPDDEVFLVQALSGG